MQLGKILLRRATVTDEMSWVDLYCAIAGELEWIGGEPPFEPGEVEGSFQRRCAARPGGLWILQEDGDGSVLGWFDLRHTVDKNWMYLGMGIAGTHRGLRLGRLLISAADREAAMIGAPGIKLDVFQHNEPARRLYFSCGFVDVEGPSAVERKDGRVFYSQEMRKKLRPLEPNQGIESRMDAPI